MTDSSDSPDFLNTISASSVAPCFQISNNNNDDKGECQMRYAVAIDAVSNSPTVASPELSSDIRGDIYVGEFDAIHVLQLGLY